MIIWGRFRMKGCKIMKEKIEEDLKSTILLFLIFIGVIVYFLLLYGVGCLWIINIPLCIICGIFWSFGFIYAFVLLSGINEVGLV